MRGSLGSAVLLSLGIGVVLGLAGSSCSSSTELIPCTRAADCPEGEVCGLISGACGGSFACETDLGCGLGAVCDLAAGLCVPNPSGGRCDTDDACPAGNVCANGFCTAAGDGGVPPPIPGLVALEVAPVQVTLTADVAGPLVVQAFTATGSFEDGTNADVTTEVAWLISSGAIGSISAAGVFSTSNVAGGYAQVVAASGSITGAADVTVLLEGVVLDSEDPNLPPNPAGSFDPASPRMSDAAESPWIVYPTDETMFPQNIFRILFQWDEGTANDLFRVSFTSPVTAISVFTTRDRWQPDETIWGWLAVSNAGAPVDVTVEGVATLDPSIVWVSDTIEIQFSTSEVQGAIYYWSTGTGAVMKGTLSDPIPTQFYGVPPDNTCVACHTVARNGTRAAVGYGGENLEVFDVPSRSVSIPAGTWDMAWSTFNPDATLVLIASRGTLTLLDATTGVPVGPNDGVVPWSIPGRFPTQPDWSPLGDAVVVAASIEDRDRNLKESGIYVIPYAAGIWGLPWPLVPSGGNDDNNYYPVYSPDSQWVAYIHSVDGSDNEPASRAMLVDAGAASPPIDLGRLNDEVNNAVGVDLGNTMPTWAPTTNVGTNWLAFSSIRDYGKILVGAGDDQLWVAAIDFGLATLGMDPSLPGFWLPFQDADETNHRAYWAHDPDMPCLGGPELCDGLDNDCDGVVDEMCTPCAKDDMCFDGIDNDCDGEVDEGCLL